MKIIFIHGFLGSTEDFDFYKNSLNNLSLEFYSLPLHQNSKSLKSFSLKTLAEDFLQSHDTNNSIIWGYSLGGRILLEAMKNPKFKAKACVLESTSPGIIDPAERNNRRNSDQEWKKKLSTPDVFLEEWYKQSVFCDLSLSPIYEKILHMRKRVINTSLAPYLLETSPGVQPFHFDVLKESFTPILALVGARDTKYLELWKKKIEKKSNIDIRVIRDSGHVIHLENPELALLEFKKFYLSRFKNE